MSEPLKLPRGWIADAGSLLDMMPSTARLEWIEQRWTLHPPSRWCRFSFSAPSNDTALEQMQDVWRTSSSGDRTVELRQSSDAHLAKIVISCELNDAVSGLIALAQEVKAFRPLVVLARECESELRNVYKTVLLQDPEMPDPRPVVERAGLLLVGGLTVHDVESYLMTRDYNRLEDGQLAAATDEARLQVWEQQGGVHVTLNPDHFPGRRL